MNALRNSPLVLTTLSGNQVSVLEGYINGNGRLTLRATTPTHGKITAEEIEPGVFRNVLAKGGFEVAPADVAELRAATLAEVAQARQETDWESYFTRTARVPKAVCAEIVAAALQQVKPTQPRPTLTVQLWEPCEVCRAQPSYSTPRGHLCERCAG